MPALPSSPRAAALAATFAAALLLFAGCDADDAGGGPPAFDGTWTGQAARAVNAPSSNMDSLVVGVELTFQADGSSRTDLSISAARYFRRSGGVEFDYNQSGAVRPGFDYRYDAPELAFSATVPGVSDANPSVSEGTAEVSFRGTRYEGDRAASGMLRYRTPGGALFSLPLTLERE